MTAARTFYRSWDVYADPTTGWWHELNRDLASTRCGLTFEAGIVGREYVRSMAPPPGEHCPHCPEGTTWPTW